LIFQNPYSSLNPRKTVRQIVSVPLKNRGLRDPLPIEAEVAHLLRRVGIPEQRMAAVPVVDREARRERIILEGNVPSPLDPPGDCRFHTRCFAKIGALCQEQEPAFVTVGEGHRAACHLLA
jgi:oligopeptide/dipeptide ABC transporter ATP-binding protein